MQTTAVVNSGLLTEVYFRKSELALSRFSSCIMLVTYAAYLFFQLKNQRNLNVPFNEEGFQIEEGSYDDEATQISKWESVIWLLIISACVSILSEYLVDTIEIPFSVVLGWIMGQPMDLNFQLFETATLFISVFVVALMLQEGTHYFKGLMLLLCYLIVAASFFLYMLMFLQEVSSK
ncbi:vacuolar cation/proton exchanger 5 [Quercus suber]|uniref:Vacuolar cation/proton exchanger 5 n=1 Tax=Quercus suber TaxID=58331 RepID=A0AAW0JHS1_QUESU